MHKTSWYKINFGFPNNIRPPMHSLARSLSFSCIAHALSTLAIPKSAILQKISPTYMRSQDVPLPFVITGSEGLVGPRGPFERRVRGNGYSSGSSSSLQNRLAGFQQSQRENLRKLPCHIILGTQSLATFLQAGKITWSHHSTSVPW